MAGDGVPPFGGGVFIVDNSAFARVRRAPVPVRHEWAKAVIGGQIATCPVTDLEILYSTRDEDEFYAVQQELSALRQVPVTQPICRAAIGAVRELAARSAGYHRVRPPDALIAAAAADVGVGVLHYDAHYDRLAEVLTFESRWLSPPGTLP